jgi:hypothetical protein
MVSTSRLPRRVGFHPFGLPRVLPWLQPDVHVARNQSARHVVAEACQASATQRVVDDGVRLGMVMRGEPPYNRCETSLVRCLKDLFRALKGLEGQLRSRTRAFRAA